MINRKHADQPEIIPLFNEVIEDCAYLEDSDKCELGY